MRSARGQPAILVRDIGVRERESTDTIGVRLFLQANIRGGAILIGHWMSFAKGVQSGWVDRSSNSREDLRLARAEWRWL